jgi:hypothetical protein
MVVCRHVRFHASASDIGGTRAATSACIGVSAAALQIKSGREGRLGYQTLGGVGSCQDAASQRIPNPERERAGARRPGTEIRPFPRAARRRSRGRLGRFHASAICGCDALRWIAPLTAILLIIERSVPLPPVPIGVLTNVTLAVVPVLLLAAAAAMPLLC